MQPLQICIVPTIRNGRESWCLPYAESFKGNSFFFYLCDPSSNAGTVSNILTNVNWCTFRGFDQMVGSIAKTKKDIVFSKLFTIMHYVYCCIMPKSVLLNNMSFRSYAILFGKRKTVR